MTQFPASTLLADIRPGAPVGIDIALPPGLAPEAVRQALAARHIHVSVRGSAVRVSPHVCNDEADLLRLAEALAEISRAAT